MEETTKHDLAHNMIPKEPHSVTVWK